MQTCKAHYFHKANREDIPIRPSTTSTRQSAIHHIHVRSNLPRHDAITNTFAACKLFNKRACIKFWRQKQTLLSEKERNYLP